jgi:hypothetical protein
MMVLLPKANASRARSVRSRVLMSNAFCFHSGTLFSLTLLCSAGSRCANGECQTGTGGKGCAACVEGFFTAGSTCQECPESLQLLIPVAVAVLVGLLAAAKGLWMVSAVNLDTAEQADEETRNDTEDTVATIKVTVDAAQSAARISNSGIISSIAFPAIFQISITFSMPFGCDAMPDS